MDSKPRIFIAPPVENKPTPAMAPLNPSLRWDPPYEHGEIQPEVTVFLAQPAYANLYIHASSDPENEVGGILVGQWCSNTSDESMFIVIENILRARYTRQSNVHLTFTKDSIVNFHHIVEQRYANKQIVGWYHTHPRMGVFLSNYDTWLHDHFFPEPWQVALVVEPHSCQGGFFIRQKNGVMDSSRYFGFYEMNGRLGRSTIRWNNLICLQDERE